MRRGDELTLKSIYDHETWELQDSGKKSKRLPGACFMLPPPDTEALEKVNRYTLKSRPVRPSLRGIQMENVFFFFFFAFRFEKTLLNLKSQRSATMTSLKTSTTEVDRPQRAGEKESFAKTPAGQSLTFCPGCTLASVQRAPEDSKAAPLARQMDDLNHNLDLCKMDMQKRHRAPVDNRNPALDLENRLQELKVRLQPLVESHRCFLFTWPRDAPPL